MQSAACKNLLTVMFVFAVCWFSLFGDTARAQSVYTGEIPVLSPEGMLQMVTENGADKVVIISIFASWCPPCREEMPMLKKFRENFAEEKLLVAGVSIDENVQDLHVFLNEYQVNFPVYFGSVQLLQVLRINQIPHTFIFNKKGKLVSSQAGLMPELKFRLLLSRLMSE